jgi:hypothetical protein
MKRVALAIALVAASLSLASAASARTEQLRWSHSNVASVAGFRVYVGNATGVYQTTLDVGMPTASGGVFTYALSVPDSNTVFVAVSAYGPTGLESPRSNEQRRLGLLGAPGKPQITP